jgi:hypothetical protein
MDQQLILWLIGQFISGLGVLYMVHRNLVTKLEAGDKETSTRMEHADNALHERINETREKYVRRDDLDAHLNSLRSDVQRMDGKLDRILERQRLSE